MSWVCLMYHDVLPATNAAGGGPERFAVPLESFERMLDTIAEAGYRGCSLSAAVAAPGQRLVAITFDDGSVSQFACALPALVARGMTATFFVTTDWIGTPGYMSWDQLRQMVDRGMSVQSHTRSHPFLSELGHDALRRELEESKAALDRALGQNTTEISLPGGNPPRRSLRPLLAEAGYRVVARSRWGRNGEPARTGVTWIRRCAARGRVTADEARRVLQGDARLALARYPREALLNGIRSVLGASRYARWRRRLLDTLARAVHGP
jgi:peptidoglycan/xylan/chitin deacetylase (PgdA/CDA1 family)